MIRFRAVAVIGVAILSSAVVDATPLFYSPASGFELLRPHWPLAVYGVSDINNAGQIIGGGSTFLNSSTSAPSTVPGASTWYISSLNNSGQMSGAINTPAGRRAARWESPTSGPTDLGLLASPGSGLNQSYAYGINDLGHVVGESNGFPFLWTPQEGCSKSLSARAMRLTSH
jgi:hypothetical protein